MLNGFIQKKKKKLNGINIILNFLFNSSYNNILFLLAISVKYPSK